MKGVELTEKHMNTDFGVRQFLREIILCVSGVDKKEVEKYQ